MAARSNPAPLKQTRSLLRIEGVTKRFGGVTALDGVSLAIAPGEFFALLGPSGCGKTTLLRMLAGFETPDAGRILLDGEDLAGVPPYRRPVNMMFQNYALFPHLTVAGNVAFGLRQEKLPGAEIEMRVREMLALVKIEALAARKPHQLSGGERQRVALARALVKRPKLFLLDEPLAALDKKLRAQTQFELKELQHRLKLTFIVVTHDQEEAMIMADRIGVMDRGRLAQVATPAEIYERPNSRWVAEFIGDVNLLAGRIGRARAGGVMVETAMLGPVRVRGAAAKKGDSVFVAIRPEKIRIAREKPARKDNAASGHVVDIGYLGDSSIYKIRLKNGATMKAAAGNPARFVKRPIVEGDAVWLSFAPESCVVLTR